MDRSRNIRDGGWYWVSKTVIRDFVPRTGFLAMGVYHFLASMADRDQCCFPSQKYVAEGLGCSRASVNVAVGRLREAGLLSVVKRGSGRCVYRLLGVRCKAGKTGMSSGLNPDVKPGDTNNTKITRLFNNDTSASFPQANDEDASEPEARERLVAGDLAEGLNDPGAFALYLRYAKKYPESFLRQVLSEVRQTPGNRIRRSRGALFTFLIRKRANGSV